MIYLFLVNFTKKEFIDLGKVYDSFFGKPPVDLFFALLWGGDHPSPMFGRWAGDQVVLLADWDICCYKATRLIKEGKLTLPPSILQALWEEPAYKTLDRIIFAEFRDITAEVIKFLCPVDLEEVG
jgi:hypothetical protein